MFTNLLRLILRMKKLLVLSAVLVGAATASHAGVNFNFGFGLPGLPLPLPTPPGLVVTHSAPVVVPPAPVYTTPQVVATPVCEPQVVAAQPVCAPSVVIHDDWRHDYHHGDSNHRR